MLIFLLCDSGPQTGYVISRMAAWTLCIDWPNQIIQIFHDAAAYIDTDIYNTIYICSPLSPLPSLAYNRYISLFI
jgi:hypothetical protein